MPRRFGSDLTIRNTNTTRSSGGSHNKLLKTVSSNLRAMPLQLKKKRAVRVKTNATPPAPSTLPLPLPLAPVSQTPAPPAPVPQTPAPLAPVPQTPVAKAASKAPSTAVRKFNKNVSLAKKLIVEAKTHSKSTKTTDWAKAVALYTQASALLPHRLSVKLQVKITHLNERIAGAEDSTLMTQHIQRAKKLIVQAKSKSKSLHMEEWCAAIELYAQARDLLPPKLGNKLSKKINSLTAKVNQAKQQQKEEEEEEDEEEEEEVDLFSDAMFDLSDMFAWKKDSTDATDLNQAAADDEEEEEEEEMAIPMVAPTPMKQAPALVFDRFGSVGAEVFALALGRCTNLRTTTTNAQELLDMLRAIDACETEILGTSDHALKSSWRKVAGRRKKRVHFCTFDLSTISPPDKWSDISDLQAKTMQANPQEKLTYKLGEVLMKAKTLLVVGGRDEGGSGTVVDIEEVDEETAGAPCVGPHHRDYALTTFLQGLKEVSNDTTVTSILRKGGDYFYQELSKLTFGAMPFVERFDKAATSSMRYHLRCLFNTKPDSITTQPESSASSSSSDSSSSDEEEAVEDAVMAIEIDQDGSYGYCGREDIAAIVHRALRERGVGTATNDNGNNGNSGNNGSTATTTDTEDTYLHMEASRFLYELLTHPGTVATHSSKASTWTSMKLLSNLIDSLSDVCPSAVHALVPLALDPVAFTQTLKHTAETTSKAMFQHLTTSDALKYSILQSKTTGAKKSKTKRKGSKGKQNKAMTPQEQQAQQDEDYILNQAPFRFKYPTLNCRGDTEAVFGSLCPLNQTQPLLTWTEEAVVLLTKMMKCKRKKKKPSRFFEKGLAAVNKQLKDDKFKDATAFSHAFQVAVGKNEKNKYDKALREECRTVMGTLFEAGLSSVLAAEEMTLKNRLCCEFCMVQTDGAVDASVQRCDTCARCVHTACVVKALQPVDASVFDGNKVTVWFCRECTGEALEAMKVEREAC